MNGQWRALGLVTAFAALLLSGCAAQPGSALPCELPEGTRLVAAARGGYLVVFEDGTMRSLAFAHGRCVLTPIRGVAQLRVERTDPQLRLLYDYYRQNLGPCLDGFGFSFLAPPSKAAFLASGGDWSPYDAVFTAMMNSAEIRELTRACPPLPPIMGAVGAD
jgi:hypothetical protein